MNTKTYNRALTALPADSQRFTGHFHPFYSPHARQAATNDRYGEFYLPHVIDIEQRHIVEVETVNGRAVKAVVRLKYNDKTDLVLVVCDPMDGELYVKTTWLNEAKDNHATLKTEILQHV